MKRLLALLLALSMVFALSACGGGGKKAAFNASKEAYDNINAAYLIVDDFGHDIYEAWRVGIFDEKNISIKTLSKELTLSEDELKEGVVYLFYSMAENDDYEEGKEEDKQFFRENADKVFQLFKDDIFSVCVKIVSAAYVTNGKVAEAQELLTSAKGQMKTLSEKYSDYEHYPALKGYYTTTTAFFDFCQNPTGSFEQVKTTINEYRNDCRSYNKDLSYIFEE